MYVVLEHAQANYVSPSFHPSPSFPILLHPSVLPSFDPSSALPSVQPWFDKQRGLATGLAMAGSGVGNLVMPFMWDAAVASQGVYNQCYIINFSVAKYVH